MADGGTTPSSPDQKRKRPAGELSEKERLDVLLKLWEGTRERVRERRNYEWKISFGIWGAQLAITALILRAATDDKSGLNLHANGFPYLLLALGLIVAAAHALYIKRFVGVRNERDRDIAVEYETEMREVVTSGREFEHMVKGAREAEVFHVSMTLSLAILGFLVALL